MKSSLPRDRNLQATRATSWTLERRNRFATQNSFATSVNTCKRYRFDNSQCPRHRHLRQFNYAFCSNSFSHVGFIPLLFPRFVSLKPFDLSFTRSQVTVDQYMISSTITNRLSCPMLLHSVSLQDTSKGLTKVFYNSFTKSSRSFPLNIDSLRCSRSRSWPT